MPGSRVGSDDGDAEAAMRLTEQEGGEIGGEVAFIVAHAGRADFVIGDAFIQQVGEQIDELLLAGGERHVRGDCSFRRGRSLAFGLVRADVTEDVPYSADRLQCDAETLEIGRGSFGRGFVDRHVAAGAGFLRDGFVFLSPGGAIRG